MEMEQLLSNKLLEWLQSDIEVDVDPLLLLVASNSYKKSLCPSNEPSPPKTFLHVRHSGIPKDVQCCLQTSRDPPLVSPQTQAPYTKMSDLEKKEEEKKGREEKNTIPWP